MNRTDSAEQTVLICGGACQPYTDRWRQTPAQRPALPTLQVTPHAAYLPSYCITPLHTTRARAGYAAGGRQLVVAGLAQLRGLRYS
jgi:hypothetical protein